MTLVPESLLENLQSPRPAILQPSSARKTSELDVEIRHILEDPGLSDSEKAEKYSQKLREFLFHKNRAVEPPTVYVKQQDVTNKVPVNQTVVSDKVTIDESSQVMPSQVRSMPPLQSDILTTVPKSLKTKAGLLIEKLHQTPNITWDDKGTVAIQGKNITGSNITDLVNDLLRKRKYFNPIGWQELGKALSGYNLPQDLIGNADRYHYMTNPPPKVTPKGTPVYKQRRRSPSAEFMSRRGWMKPATSPAYIIDKTNSVQDLESTPSRRKTRRRQVSPDWLPYRNK
ncbi:hypothetical protein SNE40_021171 [Patella caerulea]